MACCDQLMYAIYVRSLVVDMTRFISTQSVKSVAFIDYVWFVWNVRSPVNGIWIVHHRCWSALFIGTYMPQL